MIVQWNYNASRTASQHRFTSASVTTNGACTTTRFPVFPSMMRRAFASCHNRSAIARAFLHDAPFILLDEPTSNLDSLNEAVILRSLEQSRKDKTIVLVSHRASTMCIADEVYSVENGRMS